MISQHHIGEYTILYLWTEAAIDIMPRSVEKLLKFQQFFKPNT